MRSQHCRGVGWSWGLERKETEALKELEPNVGTTEAELSGEQRDHSSTGTGRKDYKDSFATTQDTTLRAPLNPERFCCLSFEFAFFSNARGCLRR